MNINVKVKNKEIDFKSVLIGFLLATVVFLSLGSGYGGTQNVRIIGVDSNTLLPVNVKEVYRHISMPTVPVKVESLNTSLEFPVKINDVGYSAELKVKVVDQPIRVQQR